MRKSPITPIKKSSIKISEISQKAKQAITLPIQNNNLHKKNIQKKPTNSLITTPISNEAVSSLLNSLFRNDSTLSDFTQISGALMLLRA